MKRTIGAFLAAFLLEHVSGASENQAHKETAIVWPLFFSAIVLSTMFALCQTTRTAPWVWPVINSVVAGLLAMQWCTLISQIEPGESDASGRLVVWIGTYLVVAGFLYMLAVSGIKFSAPPSEALAWVVATVAGGFCSAVLPDDIDHVTGVAVLLAEQLIFYFIWILPRTLEQMSLEAWKIGGVQLGVPGTKGLAPDHPVAKWYADCDGIIWGAAPFALAANGLRLITIAVTQNPSCHTGDLCAWDGKIDGRRQLWLVLSGSFFLVTVACARQLDRMKDTPGLANIAGSTILSGLTTAVSMTFLNFIRSSVSSYLCLHLQMCDVEHHQVFVFLMVAYASTVVAMLSAVAMALVEQELQPGGHMHRIMQQVQSSVSLQAGLAWYGVFDKGADSGALDKLGLGGGTRGEIQLALLLAATILPLYVYFIRPANARVQEKAAAERVARNAHLHQH